MNQIEYFQQQKIRGFPIECRSKVIFAHFEPQIFGILALSTDKFEVDLVTLEIYHY